MYLQNHHHSHPQPVPVPSFFEEVSVHLNMYTDDRYLHQVPTHEFPMPIKEKERVYVETTIDGGRCCLRRNECVAIHVAHVYVGIE